MRGRDGVSGAPVHQIEADACRNGAGRFHLAGERMALLLLARVHEALYAVGKSGEITAMWNKWLGADTELEMTRDAYVRPIA